MTEENQCIARNDWCDDGSASCCDSLVCRNGQCQGASCRGRSSSLILVFCFTVTCSRRIKRSLRYYGHCYCNDDDHPILVRCDTYVYMWSSIPLALIVDRSRGYTCIPLTFDCRLQSSVAIGYNLMSLMPTNYPWPSFYFPVVCQIRASEEARPANMRHSAAQTSSSRTGGALVRIAMPGIFLSRHPVSYELWN